MLHARAIRFPHPLGGECVLEAPIPVDLRAVIARLGLPEPAASAIPAAHAAAG
jgi:tRNA pseudouridine32 synthase/23S rRNA pseudouridine746 synthase